MPRDIDDLEPRLRARFESGVIIDMQPPDETLTAIVTQKSREIGMEISPNRTLHRGRREHQRNGVLNRLVHCLNYWKTPRLVAKKHIGHFIPSNNSGSADDIIERYAVFVRFKSSDIKGKSRQKKFVRPGTLQCTWFEPLPVVISRIRGIWWGVINRQTRLSVQHALPSPNLQSTILFIKELA